MIFMREQNIAGPVSLSFAILGGVWGAVAGMLPAIKAYVGASDAMFGQILVIASIGALCVLLNVERITTWIGPRALYWFAAALPCFVVFTVLSAQIWVFVCVLVGFAMMSSGLDVTMNARLAERQIAQKHQVMNYAHGVYGLSYAAGALYAGALQEMGLSRLVIAGVLCAVCVFAARRLWSIVPTDHSEAALDTPPMRHGTWFIVALGVIGLVSLMTEQAVDLWAGIYIERGLSQRPFFLALGPAMLGLMLGVGRFAAQRYDHLIAPMPLIVGGGILATFGGSLVSIGPNLGSVYLGFGAMGLGVSIIFPSLLNIVAQIVPQSRRVWAISRVSALSYAGTFFGPPLVGFVSEAYTISTAFWVITGVVAMIPLVGVPVVRLLAPKADRA